MAPRILIIHSDAALRDQLARSIAAFGFLVQTGAGPALPEQGVAPSLALIESAGDFTGAIAVLRRGHDAGPPVIALAAREENGAAAIQHGAADFLLIPASLERLQASIRNALLIDSLEREIIRIRRRRNGRVSFTDIITVAPEMTRAMDLARRASASSLPCLLTGEAGAGKESLARAIHGESARAAAPFIALRLECKPQEAAAHTLAAKCREAAGGTLYVCDASAACDGMQAELNALIATGKIPGGGGLETMTARLIAGTRHDLIAMAKAKTLREDLFYRLNVMPITLPPLRARTGDAAEIARRIIPRLAAEQGKRADGLDDAAIRLISAYGWPGNVRQLENAVFRAVALANSPMLGLKDFPHIAPRVEGFSVETPLEPQMTSKPIYEGLAMIGGSKLTEGWPFIAQRTGGAGIQALNENGDVRPLTAVEADMIRLALGHYRGHMTEVARKLGIGRSTLYRKMREFGLDFRVH